MFLQLFLYQTNIYKTLLIKIFKEEIPMLTILAVFSKNDLETFLKAHPFRKKFILWRMKKAKITFNEKRKIFITNKIESI